MLTDPADAHRFHLTLYAGVAVLVALIFAIAGLTVATWLGRSSARSLLPLAPSAKRYCHARAEERNSDLARQWFPEPDR
jgi:hypothetical protein